MAVEAISSPKTAYQGSVPKMDAPTFHESAKKVPEHNSAEQRTAEISSYRKKSEKIVFSADQNTESKSDSENIVISADSAKAAETKTGTEALRKAVDEINRHSKHSEAVFGFHEETNRVMIKIIDKDSREVLREFPPEETLDMIAKIWEIAGIMVDRKDRRNHYAN